MGKIAFVFSGQGAQYPGMGKELCTVSPAAKAVFDFAEEVRPGTKAQCFSGSKEELTITQNTQPCLYCTDLAAAVALRESGISANMTAGFSLGEIAALAFAGYVEIKEGFRLVCRRGELMQKAAAKHDSAMVAVVKLSNETVEMLCMEYPHVYPVNYNCPGQLVVAGLKSELASFVEKVKSARGKAIPLAVGGGFHSPFMEEAALTYRELLAKVNWDTPDIPIYSNYTALPYGDNNPSVLLAEQIKNPVRWQETIENMIADGADTFIEVGPGKTLCGLISKISKSVRCLHVEDKDSLLTTITEVKQNA